MSAYESSLRHVLCGLLALALASVTSACVVEIDDEGELVAMTDAAWVDDGIDLEIIVDANLDELTNDTEQRSVSPEPQPWDDALSSDETQSSNDEVADEEGNPEPQPWRRDGETDNPEPQPWHPKAAGELEDAELDDEQSDAPSAPTRHLLDDDEPDPNPWMVAAR